MVHFLGAVAEAGCAVQHLPSELVAGFAQVLTSLDAIRAMAAGGHERQHHMVAGLGVGDAGADFLDDPSAFMAQHHRHGVIPVSFHIVQVAVADAAGRQFYQDLAFLGSVQLQVFNDKWLEFFV